MSKMLEMLKMRRALNGQGHSKRFGDLSVLLKAVLGAQTQKVRLYYFGCLQ